MTLRIEFDRIGRNHNVDPITDIPDEITPDDLAERVHKYARRYLLSNDYEVTVDLKRRSVSIDTLAGTAEALSLPSNSKQSGR